MAHQTIKKIVIVSICAFSILLGIGIYCILDNYLYALPTVYGIDYPNAEMVKLLLAEFKTDIPDEATIEKVTLNNSKDPMASLLITGSFDVEYWLSKTSRV